VSFGEEVKDGPIVLLSGMEKIYFVPGWQISWMIFFDKHKHIDSVIKGVKNICQLLVHPNTFLMEALPKLLDTLTPLYAKKAITSFKHNHDLLVTELATIPGLRPIPAQGAFYLAVLLDLTVLSFTDDVDFVLKLLEEENIMLLPLSWNGTNKYSGFRYSVN
jgi:aspartate/methionine/tyrosine aminotransferase